MKRTGCGLSVAETLSLIHKRCAGHRIFHGLSRAAKAPCSIPLWPSGIESLSIQKSQQRSICCPASGTTEIHAWALLRSIRTGVSRIACSTLHGPINQVVLRQINATEADAQLYGRLASSVIYANPSLRADASLLIKNRADNPVYGDTAISGDLCRS